MKTMSDSIESRLSGKKHNPLLWIGIIVALVIAYLLLGTERGNTVIVKTESETLQVEGEIDRSLLVPPECVHASLLSRFESWVSFMSGGKRQPSFCAAVLIMARNFPR